MKRFALGLAAGALIVAAPMSSHASQCQGSKAPKPHSGATSQSLSPADNGTAWVWSDMSSAAQAGIAGSHGWLVVNAGTGGVSVQGHQNESGANGSLTVGANQTGPTLHQDLCLSTS